MTLSERDLAALRQFLVANGVTIYGDLIVEQLAGGRSNLTFKVSDERAAWVVRRPPQAGLTPSAHDMAREFTVVQALQASAVPVAKTVALDAEGWVWGAPLSVVEFVAGRAIRHQGDLDTLSDNDVHAAADALVRTLAGLHAVDHQAVGLQAFGRPDGYVTRQVALWAKQWERVQHDDTADVTDLVNALSARIPCESRATIVHGDFRIDNVLIDDRRPDLITAVVDWELSTLGDPLTDVALMCAYRTPIFDLVLGVGAAAWTSERLPSADDLAHSYSTVSGRDLSDWGFYLALANFKIGVIAEGIAHRARAGGASPGEEDAALAVPEFFAAARRALQTV